MYCCENKVLPSCETSVMGELTNISIKSSALIYLLNINQCCFDCLRNPCLGNAAPQVIVQRWTIEPNEDIGEVELMSRQMRSTEKNPLECRLHKKKLEVFNHQIHQKLATDVVGVSFDEQ